MGSTDRYGIPTPTPAVSTAPLMGTQAKAIAQAVDPYLNPVIVADDTARDAKFPLVGRREGQQVYRLDTDEIEFWNGTDWEIWSQLAPANASYPSSISPPENIDGYAIRAGTGTFNMTDTDNLVITFPEPFPRSCLGAHAGFFANAWYHADATSPYQPLMLQVVGWNTSTVVVAQRNLAANTVAPINGSRRISYIAWGY